MVMSQLHDSAGDAAEGVDYDDIKLAENPFEPIKSTLGLLYQHEEEVELPERYQEFFEQFSRDKNEELQVYPVNTADDAAEARRTSCGSSSSLGWVAHAQPSWCTKVDSSPNQGPV